MKNSGLGKSGFGGVEGERLGSASKAGASVVRDRWNLGTKRKAGSSDVHRIAEEKLRFITRNLQSDYKHLAEAGGGK